MVIVTSVVLPFGTMPHDQLPASPQSVLLAPVQLLVLLTVIVTLEEDGLHGELLLIVQVNT